MSKKRNIKLSNDFGESAPDVETLLRLAAPEDVALDRDAILFQAGFSARAKQHRLHILWPTAAAALFGLISFGLAIALLHEQHVSSSLRTEIAASNAMNRPAIAQTAPAQLTIATNNATSESSLFDTAPVGSLRSLRLRSWERLASGSVLPSGQLTALGAFEEQSELQREAVARATLPRRDSTTKPKPATYLELRAQQEG